jgi:hypothetical protein
MEDIDVTERKILKWILEREDGVVWTGVIWLRVVTNQWRALVNTVMNLQVP